MRKTILTVGSALLFLGALAWAPPAANARGRNDGAGNEREDRGGPSILERLLQREGEDADDGGRRGRVESDDDMDDGGGQQRGRADDDDDDDGGGRRERSSRDEL